MSGMRNDLRSTVDRICEAECPKALREAAEEMADLPTRQRVTVVRLGDSLVDLTVLWILASAVIKAMYKGRIQAEVKAAQATENAEAETLKILGIYRTFAEQFMAMPVITGLKTESEKFAGALRTYCIEAMMQDNKALQAGTSHNLGQNFAKAFDLKFQTETGEMAHAWNTSWGVSTRLIGGMVMTHSDDNGLVTPPLLAPIEVVIVPIWKSDDEQIGRAHV